MSFHRNFGSGTRPSLRSQSGQTVILVVVVLGIFLLAFIGFAVDFTNLWFHRQMAQGAADAACQAGAMDMLTIFNGSPLPTAGFTPGVGSDASCLPVPMPAFDCAGSPGAAPCRYAQLNGYSGTGLLANQESNQVCVSFPGSVPGVPPGSVPPPSLASTAFMRVDVVDRAKVFFSGLITGNRTQDVRASASCGLQLAKAPIPLIVLNPTCQKSLTISGSATLKIVGGPNKSVQVNSNNLTCAAATQSGGGCSGNGMVDLSEGGPSFTGSNFGVFGFPSTAPANYLGGTTGVWSSGSPIGDPYSRVTPPDLTSVPSAPNPIIVNWTGAAVNPDTTYGCPDHSGCIVYFPGFYDHPIVVKGETALFVPGIYFIQPTTFATDFATARGTRACGSCNAQGGTICGTPACADETKATGQACKADLLVDANGVIRPARDDAPRNPGPPAIANDGSRGTLFYFSGSSGAGWGSAAFVGNAGNPGGRIVDDYLTSNVTCPGGTPPDPRVGIPSTVSGNILNGQCTAGGNYYPFDSLGSNRGLLFFQDHSNNAPGGQATFQGSGGMLLSGTVYAHNCTASLPAATSCNPYSFPTGDWQAFVQLQGTPGSGTYVLGEIVTDQLNESGNGAVAMQLNTNAILQILKVQLLR